MDSESAASSPVALTTWQDWLSSHPDTTVLDVETGVYPGETYLQESSRFSIYYDYRERSDTMFPVVTRSQVLPTKSQVFGLTFNGRQRAYPLEVLEQEPVINDSLGGVDIVVVTPDNGAGTRRLSTRRPPLCRGAGRSGNRGFAG